MLKQNIKLRILFICMMAFLMCLYTLPKKINLNDLSKLQV